MTDYNKFYGENKVSKGEHMPETKFWAPQQY